MGGMTARIQMLHHPNILFVHLDQEISELLKASLQGFY